jgi:outer membrane protein assembly factor BamB/tetratricopeptide (TPR) repeat protein
MPAPAPLFVAIAAWAIAAPAQQVRAVPPLGAIAPPPAGHGGDEKGVPVDLFENPNIDRYFRRAQLFLDRGDYAQAIAMLQDVIEGRTTEILFGGDDGAANAPPPPAPPGQDGRRRSPEPPVHDPVFSQDGRLFRPVRRLCHEVIAKLPPIGLEIYRTSYEAAAEALLQEAVASGHLPALEQVAHRYFATLPAGRAMALAADRLLHEGRPRAAVQVLRDLLDVYPAAHRARLGIDEVWCRFKIALGLTLAGEADLALAEARLLAEGHPLAALRVEGELHAVKDLIADGLVGRREAPTARADRSLDADVWRFDDGDPLVPLWQFRFRNPDPYRGPRPTSERQVIFFDAGSATAAMPFANRYGPATWVTFAPAADDAQVLFLEHFRLRVAGATSGLLVAQGDGSDEPPPARENQPRIRIAAVDQATLRPVDDGERRYALLGHGRASTSSVELLKASELVAYDHGSGKVAWRSSQWREGAGGLLEVTFLAAPTVFGETLLLPALRSGRYAVECLDRRTGRPLWHTVLHAGGTPFFKAPGCPVAVQDGVAYVATNAGCVAAVDAFTGGIRWLRRYERSDPLRTHARARQTKAADEMALYQGQFAQLELPGFHPNDLQLHQGLVIVAPCDSDMLLGLDGATGQPVWMLDATTRYAAHGKLRTLVGIAGTRLFALSDTHLVAIGAEGGLLEWARELPAWQEAKSTGRGRGTVVGETVLIPGEREVIAVRVDGSTMVRVPLPAFDQSREPLAGAANLVVCGPWLAVGYAGGVEVFGSAKGLLALAATTTDVRRRAELLARAAAVDEAMGVLVTAIRDGDDAGRSDALGLDLLRLLRPRALAAASPGSAAAGLRLLDSCRDEMRGPESRLAWHLARVDLCREVSDQDAHEREQNRLYSFLEGKQWRADEVGR